jgi:hypothetical protein
LFGTIVDRDTSGLAQELVVCGFIGVLKTTPPAYVVDEDGPVWWDGRHNILQKLAQASPVLEDDATFGSVGIALNDFESM